MIETKHTEPITYRIYDFLKPFKGKENAISGADLAAKFGISKRQLRTYIHEIRNSSELTRIIGSCNAGYYMCREEDFEAADKRLERQALSTLKVVWSNRKKRAKDGQYKIPLGDYYKEIFEAFSE